MGSLVINYYRINGPVDSGIFKYGLPEPDIIEKDGGFMVTLHKVTNDTVEGITINDTIEINTGGQVGGQVGGQGDRKINSLTDRQKEVFRIIVSNPRISRKQLAEILGINESAVQKHIDALKKKGIIERESETTGKWSIIVKI